MQALRMPQTDTVAVAPNCFDLPMAQGVIIEKDETSGLIRCTSNLVSLWEDGITDEQLAEIVKTKKVRMYVRLVTAVTPPIAVTASNPFDIYDDLITLKDAQKMLEDTNQV